MTVTQADHNFFITDNASMQITLTVDQSIESIVTIISGNSIDLKIRLIILFSGKVSLQLIVLMCGQKSKVIIDGIYALAEHDFLEIKTNQIHCASDNYSTLRLHGILAGAGHVRHDGNIMITKDAPRTYALQQNKNIVLSPQARAISIPNIEVLNNDVQCFHGAAVGRFDMNHSIYLQSRGLDDTVIKKLLVQGHFGDFLSNYDKKDIVLDLIYKKI